MATAGDVQGAAAVVKLAEALDDSGEVFADSAYRGSHVRDAVCAKGSVPRIIATGMWGHDEAETLQKLKDWNQPIHRVRGRIEKIFGTWKRRYGLRHMRWRGIAKAASPLSPTLSNEHSISSNRQDERGPANKVGH